MGALRSDCCEPNENSARHHTQVCNQTSERPEPVDADALPASTSRLAASSSSLGPPHCGSELEASRPGAASRLGTSSRLHAPPQQHLGRSGSTRLLHGYSANTTDSASTAQRHASTCSASSMLPLRTSLVGTDGIDAQPKRGGEPGAGASPQETIFRQM